MDININRNRHADQTDVRRIRCRKKSAAEQKSIGRGLLACPMRTTFIFLTLIDFHSVGRMFTMVPAHGLRFLSLRICDINSIICVAVSIAAMSTAIRGAAASAVPKAPSHVVVVGGGIQGTSVAYHLAQRSADSAAPPKITLLESQEPASAASGKGGGFMARSWGDGSPTQSLHHVAFDMYGTLAQELKCTSYRKLPVLSVAPSRDGKSRASSQTTSSFSELLPSWLDGSTGRISPMGYGDDTAQITPKEFVQAMLDHSADRIQLVKGTCVGVESISDDETEDGANRVTGVQYRVNENGSSTIETLEADCVVVSAGPWSCAAEDWFPASNVQLPMEGIKSTSIVWKQPDSISSVDATALFCGENNRFGTHCKNCECIYEKHCCSEANNEFTLCGSFRAILKCVFRDLSGGVPSTGRDHLYLWHWWE